MILCTDKSWAEASALELAAETLGAQVARISASLSGPDGPSRVTEATSVLGALYDAIG